MKRLYQINSISRCIFSHELNGFSFLFTTIIVAEQICDTRSETENDEE